MVHESLAHMDKVSELTAMKMAGINGIFPYKRSVS